MGIIRDFFSRNHPKPTAQPTPAPAPEPVPAPPADPAIQVPGLNEDYQSPSAGSSQPKTTLPDYSTYSDQQLAECFLPKNWSAEGFGNTQKQALLQEVSNRFAASHGVDPVPVQINAGMHPKTMGAYHPGSRSIDMNPKHLDNPFNALDCITHETQHYVDDMNVRRGAGDTPENLAVYACENSRGGYGVPPKDNTLPPSAQQDALNYYRVQALEVHANNAGFAAVASNHDLFKNCPEYQEYLGKRASYFGSVKNCLESDPEKWKAMELAHIRNAAGQPPETIKMACDERNRGIDAQQRAILNADAVRILQHDCARQQQSAAQSHQGTTYAQNAATSTTPGQDRSLHGTAPGNTNTPESPDQKQALNEGNERMNLAPEADKSDTPTSSRSQHDAFVESLRVKPGQGAGQGAGQASGQNSGTATDGAPEPPERERERTRDDGEERMNFAEETEEGKQAANVEASEAPANTEGQNTENAETAETKQAHQPTAAENQESTSENHADSKDEGQALHTEDEAPEDGEKAAPDREETVPEAEDSKDASEEARDEDNGESQPAEQAPEEEGQTSRTEEEAPVDGEETAPDWEETAPEAESNEDASVEARDEDNGESQPAEQAPEEEGQTPRAEEEAPDNGEDEAHDREDNTPTPETEEGIQDHPQEDDHGPNDGPGQTAAEEEEGIREPEPEQENAHGAEEADGIREEPSAPRENAADEDEGIRDLPREEAPQEEDDGIRNEPEAADSAQPQEDQSEGISGQDTAPAPSEGAEQSMGQ